eukprot:140977-Heterocapsa_arctica.AAC.1
MLEQKSQECFWVPPQALDYSTSSLFVVCVRALRGMFFELFEVSCSIELFEVSSRALRGLVFELFE